MGVEACSSVILSVLLRGMERLYISRERPDGHRDAAMHSLVKMGFICVPCVYVSHDLGMDGRYKDSGAYWCKQRSLSRFSSSIPMRCKIVGKFDKELDDELRNGSSRTEVILGVPNRSGLS